MNKIILLIFTIFIVTSCATDIQKIDVFINGKKQTLYKPNNIFSTTSNQITLYTSKTLNPNSKITINNKLLILIPQNTSIKQIENKYNIKFVKYINKNLKLAIFQDNINNILETTNSLNKDGIKASFDYSRKLNLY